jgi:hypothetical protein
MLHGAAERAGEKLRVLLLTGRDIDTLPSIVLVPDAAGMIRAGVALNVTSKGTHPIPTFHPSPYIFPVFG